MSSFTTKLIVTPIDEKRWELVEPFEYVIEPYEKNYASVKVPIGFLTDFASIPRFFWRVLPPWDISYGKAAIVHDYLYKKPVLHLPDNHMVFKNGGTYIIDKIDADKIFLEAMTVLEVPKWKRTCMYYAVKWFGNKSWKNHRRNDDLPFI